MYGFKWIVDVLAMIFMGTLICSSEKLDRSKLSSDYLNKINIVHYQGSTAKNANSYKYPINKATELKNNLDMKKPFTLYVHGYSENYTEESVQTVLDAHLVKGDDNFVILDWSAFGFDNYIIVAQRAQKIAMHLAATIEDLVTAKLIDIDRFRIVSHSLGSQISGYTGQYLSFEIPRITALDPAMPLFYGITNKHINKDSAKIVDVIHTDAGIYGASSNTGTIDFYANGGTRPQPGCPITGFCSHHRSWKFYAESVGNADAFQGLECPSNKDFKNNKCDGNKVVYFGYHMPLDATGTYYFSTNDKSPFGRYANGTKA